MIAPRPPSYCVALGLRCLHNIPPGCTCTASANRTHSPFWDIFTSCINIQTAKAVEYQFLFPVSAFSEIRQKSHFAE
jgi:hypothetical protein